jgi:hypothetical protein
VDNVRCSSSARDWTQGTLNKALPLSYTPRLPPPFGVVIVLFWDRVSHYFGSAWWPGIHDSPASASWVVGILASSRGHFYVEMKEADRDAWKEMQTKIENFLHTKYSWKGPHKWQHFQSYYGKLLNIHKSRETPCVPHSFHSWQLSRFSPTTCFIGIF